MNIVSEEKSWLEWTVFAVSCILIVVLLGYLVKDAVSDDGAPPDLRIELGQPEASAHGFVVPVAVTNKGDQTARAVELEVSSDSQTATLTYDFLSADEVRQGWVGFSGEPSTELRSRVVGYRTR